MKRALAALLALCAFGTLVWASDGTTVNAGATQDITAFSVCKRVTNGAGAGLYVPTTSAGEWSSFYNAPPSAVTIANCGCTVTPGSQSFTTAGTSTFTVPCHNTMTVQVWGGGGGGGGYYSGYGSGTAGGNSSWNGTDLVASGGTGGGSTASPGSGGTASGGTTNTTGENGEAGVASNYGGRGGNSPSGGAGGARKTSGGAGNTGTAPGGAGGGSFVSSLVAASGGGAGGYATRSYAAGTYAVNAPITVVVGNYGTEGKNGQAYEGGRGSVGRVTITWN